MSRTAPRKWEVHPEDDDRAARSWAAVHLIGKLIGGAFSVAAPTESSPWLFVWQDLSTDDEPLRPEWTVDLDDQEMLDLSHDAADLIAEFIGGTVSLEARRVEHQGQFVTVGVTFKWKSYAPAVEPEVPVNGAEPEPVAAG